MSAINDLIAQIENPELRERIRRDVVAPSKKVCKQLEGYLFSIKANIH